MLALGSLAFLNPWLLLGLIALPALWYILRATPPAPARISFPGVRLLLGLEDPEKTPDRTPWWLLLLRMAIAAAAILAFADPVLNPKEGLSGDGPVVVVMDGGWASAPDWEARREAALGELDRAERADRPVSFHNLAAPLPPEFALDLRPAAEWRGEIEALLPAAWAPQRIDYALAFEGINAPDNLQTAWITDGLSHGDEGAMANALASIGGLKMIFPERSVLGLSAPRLDEGNLIVSVLRSDAKEETTHLVSVFGAAPEGDERRLGTLEATLIEGEMSVDAEVDLPLELRNQITRMAIIGEDSAGATVLTDESVRRRRVGMATGASEDGALKLVSNLHYLRTALASGAELTEGDVSSLLLSNPDAMFLADIGKLTDQERETLTEWVDNGGLLVRFAGPRLARGADLAAGGTITNEEDPLLPVQLRAGGRAVGGAMAWGAPQKIRDFGRESPFFGLTAPREVSVSRQILARLGPDLGQKTWAALEDGTPLVTAAERGAGRVVLFHVTANAEWSSLPLSGLFVDMLDRLIALSGTAGGAEPPDPAELMRQVAVIDGFGRVSAADGQLNPVPAKRLGAIAAPDAPPGLYAGETARVAYNLFNDASPPEVATPAPLSATVDRLGLRSEQPFAAYLLTIALILLAIDLFAALWLSGRRFRLTPGAAALLVALIAAPQADAQDTTLERALIAANNTVLAYVITGDAKVDRISAAGVLGLSRFLNSKTAIEPVEPLPVDLEVDDLSLYPLIYWPITEGQPTPSAEASARLNEFMRNGGMLMIDTRDAHLASPGQPGPNTRALRRLVANLDLPPLAPVHADHVLTRTFYLLDRFPGRWTGGQIWLEEDRTLDRDDDAQDQLISDPNDGVSPVVIGSADWAAAWAIGDDGEFILPVGRGNGYRQREMALRTGVNVVMYAMTGNYKSDQVHVPALLERISQ
ncbi:MAG: DUF4159 domain-containing protein [Paracoccaceae bacterium]|nr:DUF4159 domain-containing protein [Paracoccaceae bacterium]